MPESSGIGCFRHSSNFRNVCFCDTADMGVRKSSAIGFGSLRLRDASEGEAGSLRSVEGHTVSQAITSADVEQSPCISQRWRAMDMLRGVTFVGASCWCGYP